MSALQHIYDRARNIIGCITKFVKGCFVADCNRVNHLQQTSSSPSEVYMYLAVHGLEICGF